MLSEWALMAAPDGLVVNGYLPGRFTLPHAGTNRVLMLDHDYPRSDSQRVFIFQGGGDEWTLHLRIPAWSRQTRLRANFPGVTTNAPAGSYVQIRRRWQACDEVVLEFDAGLRAVAGVNEAAGKVSLYRGPLLLAYDQAQNAFDEDALPLVNLARLAEARRVEIETPRNRSSAATGAVSEPWCVVEVPAGDGRLLRLVDFASAGAAGTRYRSWLAATNPPPAPAFTQLPADGARVPLGEVRFQWRGERRAGVSRAPNNATSYRAEFAANDSFVPLLFATNVSSTTRVALNTKALNGRAGGTPAPLYWRVVSISANGETIPEVPPARFILDPSAPQQVWPPDPKPGPNGELISHSLRGDGAAQFGETKSAKFTMRDAEGTEVNGRDEMLVYAVPVWPEEEFSVAVRVQLSESQGKRAGQIFSAWAAGMDDPLRLMVEGGKVFARIEAGGAFSTAGVALEAGRWYHVAAVKRGATLTLFLDGQPVGSSAAPAFTNTQATDCALGGNPHFSGNEFLAARFADFAFFARALTAEEIQGMAGK